MRSDFHKLLCLRGRIGGGWKKKRRGPKHAHAWYFELTTDRESMSRSRGSKALNEYLAPLENFLRRRVGTHFDSVYSEIRRGMRLDNAIHLHVMQHLAIMLLRHVEFENGWPKPYPHLHFWRSRGLWTGFYVCPNTSMLCESCASRSARRSNHGYLRGCECHQCAPHALIRRSRK
jgi:hypothetical protein